MPPAARLTDPHVCPMVTGVVPHVGGPILPPCCPTVMIGFSFSAEARMPFFSAPPRRSFAPGPPPGKPATIMSPPNFSMSRRCGSERMKPGCMHV